MRNVFDQYSQPENRLTHALSVALAEDRRLLRRFLAWAVGKRVSRNAPLEIVEQGLPGEWTSSEMDADKRGLPDACIFESDDWILVIESKIAAPLRAEQLHRHFRTLNRRGFRNITLLAIAVDATSGRLPYDAMLKTWSDVYAWLVRQSSWSEWARRAADYFIVAENRSAEEGYLTAGTLTTFAGIPFRHGEPYNYPEAKRLLKLAIAELRKNRQLVRELGMDPKGTGRGAITGKDGVAVWDFLRLKGSRSNAPFTNRPHLTLSIEADRVLAIVTVPHGIESRMRKNLVELGHDGFQDLLETVNARLLRALRKAPGASPWVITVQRRYPSQRSAAIVDARIEFDLRTAFQQARKGLKVRPQPQWLEATHKALSRKRSNLQVSVGAIFPYRTCPATTDHKIVDHVANVWLACKPFLEVMRDGNR
jgi:hypothetical protein